MSRKYEVEARFLGRYMVELEARSREEAEYEAMLGMLSYVKDDAEEFFRERVLWTVKEGEEAVEEE